MQRPRLRLALATIAIAVALAASTQAKNKKIRGFITEIVSPETVMVEDYRVHLTPGTRIVVDDPTKGLQPTRESLLIGTEIEVQGNLAPNGSDLDAAVIRVNTEQLGRHLLQSVHLHEPIGPIEADPNGRAQGDIIADGRHIRIEPSTIFGVLPPGETDVEEAVKRASVARGSRSATDPLAPLSGTAGFGSVLTYDGIRQPDGSVLATSAVLTSYRYEKDEAKLWAELTPKVRPPYESAADDAGRRDTREGELKVDGMKWKLYPDEQLRQYVERVGRRIMPPVFRVQPDEEGKLNFRFFIVEEKYANAFCLPNGVVGVNTAMLRLLENEAQLAAVMAHEISHATQKHTLREMRSHKTARTLTTIGTLAGMLAGGNLGRAIYDVSSMVGGAIMNGYSRNLENQADRVGLQYMVEAGYDPRQAPEVWEVMTRKFGDAPTNFFWSNHDSHTTRRSYLMTEMRANYSNLDFSHFQIGVEQFQEATARIKRDRK